LGSTIDYAAYLLGIPNSHGGPINGLIVQTFSLDSQTEGVPSLNGEGEFLELFFGGGASVILGLEGTLSVKIERMQNQNEYEMTFLIDGAITADLMAGVEAGVKGNLSASGMIQAGIPTVFKFTSQYDAIRGMATGMRIAMMLGSTPLVYSAGLPAWIAAAIIIERTIDDVRWLFKHLVEMGLQVAADVQFGAELSAGDFGGDGDDSDPVWSLASGSISTGTNTSFLLKGRIDSGKCSVSLVWKIEQGIGGSGDLFGWGLSANGKGAVFIEIAAKDFTSALKDDAKLVDIMRYKSHHALMGKALKDLENPSFNIGAGIKMTGETGFSSSSNTTIEAEIKVSLQLLDILRSIYGLIDANQTILDSVAHLGNAIALDLGAKSQSVSGISFAESVKICGVGFSLKFGYRQGNNVGNFPYATTVTPSLGVNLAYNWFQSTFTAGQPPSGGQ